MNKKRTKKSGEGVWIGHTFHTEEGNGGGVIGTMMVCGVSLPTFFKGVVTSGEL